MLWLISGTWTLLLSRLHNGKVINMFLSIFLIPIAVFYETGWNIKKSDTNQPNKTNFIEFVLASNTKISN